MRRCRRGGRRTKCEKRSFCTPFGSESELQVLFAGLSLPVHPELWFKCVLTHSQTKHPSSTHGPDSHRFSDLAAEHVDPEDLGVVVALGEGEAVALRCAIMSSHTKQDLINGVVGDL